MADSKKNLCAMIPVELHDRVRAAQEQAGVTLSAYITELLTNYYEKGSEKSMEGMRTMAFQMSEEMFQRLKKHLERESARTGKKVTQHELLLAHLFAGAGAFPLQVLLQPLEHLLGHLKCHGAHTFRHFLFSSFIVVNQQLGDVGAQRHPGLLLCRPDPVMELHGDHGAQILFAVCHIVYFSFRFW